MQYRRYESVIDSLSGSSSEYDKSEDELSYEEYDRESKFSGQEATGSRLFRRWFLNIIDLPNSLTNRLKDWLRAPPGSRGSTTDKSSGTNSVHPSEIQLTGNAESDDERYEEYRHRRHRESSRKNYRAPGAHRPPKNHRVCHTYEQNEIGFQRSVGGQRNYSTSWLQRDGRFSSSPVLVLPRIDPDTGQPIFHPRSYHSRTSTERRSVARRNGNWRSEILEFQANRYTHLRGDSRHTESFVDKQIAENSQSSLKPTKGSASNDDALEDDGELDPKSVQSRVADSRAFPETTSMRLNLEDSRSPAQTPDDSSLDKNSPDRARAEEAREEKSDQLRVLPNFSAAKQPNVDELLVNLRQKISSRSAEKKFNSPLGRSSSSVEPETGSRGRENLFSSRWQEKSVFFARELRSSYGEARASFAERIQDIWIQERTSSQWAVLHGRGTCVFPGGSARTDIDDFREEKEIKRDVADRDVGLDGKEVPREEREVGSTDIGTNGRGNEEAPTSSLSSSSVNEISEPTVCHAAVQYSAPEAKASGAEESHRPPVFPSGKNDDVSEIETPTPLKPFAVSNEILVDSTQLPASRETGTPARYQAEGAADFAPTLRSVSVESRLEKEKLSPSGEFGAKKTFSTAKDATRNIKAKCSKFLFQRPQKKRLGHRLKSLRKIGLGPSIRFSRGSFLRAKNSRFPKKVRTWLAQRFQRDRRSSRPSMDDGRNFCSTKTGQLGCMGNIFRCAEKTSEFGLSEGFLEDGPTLVEPTPRRKKRRARGTRVTTDTTSEVDGKAEPTCDAKSTAKRVEEIEADFRAVEAAVEAAAGVKSETHGERSTTTLSVTTSDSTDIPLQLLGSTSDTTIGPSHDSQDDFKRRVAESPGRGTEIMTRKQEIETSEETDDCRADLSPLGDDLELEERSRIFEFDDVLKTVDGREAKVRKNGEEESSRLEERSTRADRTRKGPRSTVKSPVGGRRRREAKSGQIVDDEKRSLDVESPHSRGRGLGGIEKRRANDVRLERRESIIDIGVEKSSRSSSKRKSAEIRDTSDGSENRKFLPVAPGDESSGEAARKERGNLEKEAVRGLNSTGFHPDSMPASASKKLRQRADSPMIPRRATDSRKRRSVAGGKSSLIPVGIGNSKFLSAAGKSDEKETTRIHEPKFSEEKNRTALNSSQKCRTSLKKSSKDNSGSNGKKMANHRVHFELEKSSSKEAELEAGLKMVDGKKCKDFSGDSIDRSLKPRRKIDDKRLVRKIQSSLENGMPLKRITIMDPYAVSERSGVGYDGGVRSKVEKPGIDQTRVSRANTQNLTTRAVKTRPISRVDKELVDQTCPYRAPLLSEQIPKLGGSFEKRHPNETKLSYRSRSREKDKSDSTDYPAQRRGSKNANESIIDFARIKERVETEILEKTSRTSGTEDSDCAIVLIKAIDSSTELSDVR